MLPPRADRLQLEVHVDGSSIELAYDVDGVPGVIALRYPEGAGPRPAGPEVDVLAVAAAAYLGSLALARDVRIARPLPEALIADFAPLVGMLYDVRCWKDDLPLLPAPRIAAPVAPGRPAAAGRLDARHAALPWSGGKDSTLALLTLRANGYTVSTAHVTANSGVEASEQAAVAALADALDERRPAQILYAHDDFLRLSNAYAVAWDDFPLCNRVPFGRDLLLAAAIVPFALAQRAGAISFGHDHECRTASVSHGGRSIPRNDVESADGALALERVLRRHVADDLRLLPPVAAISELRILRDMFVLRPDLMAKTAFCFWGHCCGRCAKCLRYYLADRVYAGDVLAFDVCPLVARACPELAELLDPAPRSTLFQREVLVLLGRLAERGDIRPEEDELRHFTRTVFPQVRPHLGAWESALLATHPDPQVPADFRPLSELATAPQV